MLIAEETKVPIRKEKGGGGGVGGKEEVEPKLYS